MILTSQPPTTSELPAAKVGPVRSGRLVYADIAAFFPESCLIYAFASPEVLELLPQCFFVNHDLQGGGYLLEINELKRLAEESKLYDIDYSSNAFAETPPAGGEPAARLDVYVAYLNQAAWIYDAASQTYWRFVDKADIENPGVLYPEIDRLTSRQLQFENVIVLFTKHDVVSPPTSTFTSKRINKAMRSYSVMGKNMIFSGTHNSAMKNAKAEDTNRSNSSTPTPSSSCRSN
ncbi:MAG: DUF3048 C-terminal domain-containing protein [Anaerolineales bacterium]|nr:DUF3048 C-terminal domain-containing protein [Anaerolineales bacterium]